MRAVVLAAGRGSRIGWVTDDRPKCLVEVGGRTLLSRQVEALEHAGADEIAVVTGWCADAFAEVPLHRFTNHRWAETSMVESLACAGAWLTAGDTVVSYGDIVYTPRTAARLAETDAPIALAFDPDWRRLWSERFEDPLDDAETFAVDPDGRVTEIGARPTTLEEVQGQYMGLLRFTPAGWAEAVRVHAAHGASHMTELLGRVVRAGRCEVVAVAGVGPWYEFDHPRDLHLGAGTVAAIDAELMELRRQRTGKSGS
ncbi:NTP transferase domain-containing protein [Streptomyces sp. 4N509B]|uniref:phosphocholine cytidylyltransferase family protein n=1 Tax=Streptomyces sp. 4N509B TaxID=3457413 RepID=UPI003FD4B33B